MTETADNKTVKRRTPAELKAYHAAKLKEFEVRESRELKENLLNLHKLTQELHASCATKPWAQSISQAAGLLLNAANAIKEPVQ